MRLLYLPLLLLLPGLATSVLLGQVTIGGSATTAPTSGPATHPADWMVQARYGLFTHFLPGADPVESGKLMEAFDAEALAEQVKESGAGYLIFTLHQNSGWINSPNKTYERITGYAPGERTSKRDLPADLAKALKKRGLRLMLYVPCQVPNEDRRAQKAFGLRARAGDQILVPAFVENWKAVLQEWSDRYGEDVSGFWFDGAYRKGCSFSDEIAAEYKKAVRHGNPKSIVAFAAGWDLKPFVQNSPSEDITAGEQNEPFKPEAVPASRIVEGGAQWHALTYLGTDWMCRNTRFTDEQWIEWMGKVISKGGVVTLDVGPNGNWKEGSKQYQPQTGPVGSLSEAQMKQLKAIREGLSRGANK